MHYVRNGCHMYMNPAGMARVRHGEAQRAHARGAAAREVDFGSMQSCHSARCMHAHAWRAHAGICAAHASGMPATQHH